ncbi:hypothetical protein ACOME3_007169 [Neoechinorhynchus agilis]
MFLKLLKTMSNNDSERTDSDIDCEERDEIEVDNQLVELVRKGNRLISSLNRIRVEYEGLLSRLNQIITTISQTLQKDEKDSEKRRRKQVPIFFTVATEGIEQLVRLTKIEKELMDVIEEAIVKDPKNEDSGIVPSGEVVLNIVQASNDDVKQTGHLEPEMSESVVESKENELIFKETEKLEVDVRVLMEENKDEVNKIPGSASNYTSISLEEPFAVSVVIESSNSIHEESENKEKCQTEITGIETDLIGNVEKSFEEMDVVTTTQDFKIEEVIDQTSNVVPNVIEFKMQIGKSEDREIELSLQEAITNNDNKIVFTISAQPQTKNMEEFVFESASNVNRVLKDATETAFISITAASDPMKEELTQVENALGCESEIEIKNDEAVEPSGSDYKIEVSASKEVLDLANENSEPIGDMVSDIPATLQFIENTTKEEDVQQQSGATTPRNTENPLYEAKAEKSPLEENDGSNTESTFVTDERSTREINKAHKGKSGGNEKKPIQTGSPPTLSRRNKKKWAQRRAEYASQVDIANNPRSSNTTPPTRTRHSKSDKSARPKTEDVTPKSSEIPSVRKEEVQYKTCKEKSISVLTEDVSLKIVDEPRTEIKGDKVLELQGVQTKVEVSIVDDPRSEFAGDTSPAEMVPIECESSGFMEEHANDENLIKQSNRIESFDPTAKSNDEKGTLLGLECLEKTQGRTDEDSFTSGSSKRFSEQEQEARAKFVEADSPDKNTSDIATLVMITESVVQPPSNIHNLALYNEPTGSEHEETGSGVDRLKVALGSNEEVLEIENKLQKAIELSLAYSEVVSEATEDHAERQKDTESRQIITSPLLVLGVQNQTDTDDFTTKHGLSEKSNVSLQDSNIVDLSSEDKEEHIKVFKNSDEIHDVEKTDIAIARETEVKSSITPAVPDDSEGGQKRESYEDETDNPDNNVIQHKNVDQTEDVNSTRVNAIHEIWNVWPKIQPMIEYKSKRVVRVFSIKDKMYCSDKMEDSELRENRTHVLSKMPSEDAGIISETSKVKAPELQEATDSTKTTQEVESETTESKAPELTQVTIIAKTEQEAESVTTESKTPELPQVINIAETEREAQSVTTESKAPDLPKVTDCAKTEQEVKSVTTESKAPELPKIMYCAKIKQEVKLKTTKVEALELPEVIDEQEAKLEIAESKAPELPEFTESAKTAQEAKSLTTEFKAPKLPKVTDCVKIKQEVKSEITEASEQEAKSETNKALGLPEVTDEQKVKSETTGSKAPELPKATDCDKTEQEVKSEKTEALELPEVTDEQEAKSGTTEAPELPKATGCTKTEQEVKSEKIEALELPEVTDEQEVKSETTEALELPEFTESAKAEQEVKSVSQKYISTEEAVLPVSRSSATEIVACEENRGPAKSAKGDTGRRGNNRWRRQQRRLARESAAASNTSTKPDTATSDPPKCSVGQSVRKPDPVGSGLKEKSADEMEKLIPADPFVSAPSIRRQRNRQDNIEDIEITSNPETIAKDYQERGDVDITHLEDIEKEDDSTIKQHENGDLADDVVVQELASETNIEQKPESDKKLKISSVVENVRLGKIKFSYKDKWVFDAKLNRLNEHNRAIESQTSLFDRQDETRCVDTIRIFQRSERVPLRQEGRVTEITLNVDRWLLDAMKICSRFVYYLILLHP